MNMQNTLHKSSSSDHNKPVIIVSGLPRSGTSMMMQILAAGGLEILTDKIRTPDDDNPKGYYELEQVKKLKENDARWLESAPGKAVKVISYLLEKLPSSYTYKVIFMLRNMDEVLASQRQMLIRRGAPTDKVDDTVMADMFKAHLEEVQSWLAKQPNFQVLYIHYDELLEDPDRHIRTLANFLGMPVNLEAMLAVPDSGLHRQHSNT